MNFVAENRFTCSRKRCQIYL